MTETPDTQPSGYLDWKAVFLAYRDRIIEAEGIDYLGRTYGDLCPPAEQAVLDEAINAHDAAEDDAKKIARAAEIIARITADPSIPYIIDRGEAGQFLVKDGVETPVRVTTFPTREK